MRIYTWALLPLVLGGFLLSPSETYVKASNILQRRMRYVNVTERHNTEHISESKAWVDKGALNIDMRLVKPFVPGFRAFIEIKMKLENAKHYQTLFSYEMDVCKLMNELSQETILKKWFHNMLKFSNFMENCPVLPDFYYVRNMTMDGANIPVYLQPGLYTFGARMYYGRRNSKRQQFVMEIVPELQIY